MPNGSNRTEKQHYVPQVYLKGFASQYVYQSREKNKNSKTKYGVFYYDLQERTQSKIAVPIKSVCFENDLYEDEKYCKNISEEELLKQIFCIISIFKSNGLSDWINFYMEILGRLAPGLPG